MTSGFGEEDEDAMPPLDDLEGEDRIIPFEEGRKIAQKAAARNARSGPTPEEMFGVPELEQLAALLNDARAERTPEITRSILASRLAEEFEDLSIFRAIVVGVAQTPYGSELRTGETRKQAINKVKRAIASLEKAIGHLSDPAVVSYAGTEDRKALQQCRDNLQKRLDRIEAERGSANLNFTLGMTFAPLRQFAEDLCGRRLRTVRRETGEEQGPLFEFCFRAITKMIPDLDPNDLATALRTWMREPRE